MQISLIRHTPTSIQKGICIGQTDVQLDESAIELFPKIKSEINPENSIVYSSPLQRCAQLAKSIFTSSTILFDDRLKEIYFGEWENKPWTEINNDDLNNWMEDFVNIAPKGGETGKVFYERVESFIEETLSTYKKEDSIVIVTHAGVIRSFVCYVLEIPFENLYRIPMNYSSITKLYLDFENGDHSLLELNRIIY
jgi:alpha-ribazole phosphatase